ncbi:MAG: beta-galactosidase trimerization domain-containing protein, partial [Flavisolibacter sp.]|nr:beta-galactosidase trimerization domain-containing protein [Flavisolibacter sp.]
MSQDSENNFSGSVTLPRRDFLQLGTVLAGGMLLSPVLSKTAIITDYPVDKTLFWYQKPLRIMHTVLREIDARNYDANAVVDYMKKGGYNTLCVNAGGIVDFFQNPLPAANVNRLMGNRDILKEISSACRKAGFKVIARIDFRGVEEHVFKKFPDWFMKDENQKPKVMNWTKPELYESCYSGKHRNEYANEYVSYVLKNYEVDGIWHNSPGFRGICYCERCQASYKAKVGKAIPVADAASEAEMDQYMDWKRQAADEYMNRIKQTVKSFGNDKVYTAEVFSLYGLGTDAEWGIDLKNAKDHFDILVSVAFLTGQAAVNYYYDLNYGSTIIKFLKSMVPDREAVVMYGGNGTSHRLVIDPQIDLKIWLWQILSAGGRFWNCYFTNVPTQTHDNRNAFNETEAYQFVKANEKLLEQHVPVANVGIYYSRPTRLSYHKKSVEGEEFGTEIRGFENVLMENHIPNDFILDDQLSEERLKKYKVVILPNVRCMSDKEVEVLKNYVRNGGNIIATYSTSLYDEEGKERKDYGLSELFGVHYAGKRENTRRDNYQYILNKKHPIVAPDSPQTELLF